MAKCGGHRASETEKMKTIATGLVLISVSNECILGYMPEELHQMTQNNLKGVFQRLSVALP